MEEKMKRESKTCMETLFKKSDKLGSGAITVDAMRDIVKACIPNFVEHEELETVMQQYVKIQRYQVLNPQTRLMEVNYQNDSIDFPSAMAIVVRFLKKYERRSSDAFSSKGLIRFTDLPSSDAQNIRRQSEKRRLY